MTYYLAVDIGASSGRHILGHIENGKIILEELYRFQNEYAKVNGHSCWNIGNLFKEIINGMKACKAADKIPVSMGIDTWAIDFVLLNQHGQLLGDAVAYRDKRTENMDVEVERHIPFTELYQRTGIQKQIFNTVYQLAALKKEQPKLLKRAEHFLMIPDYFNYRLTGTITNEYTNATSTALVSAQSKTWDPAVLSALGFPEKLFGKLHIPGTRAGRLTKEIQAEAGFDCEVMLPATHDTGSAFLAVPAEGDSAVTISSGTWSLLGVENPEPITTLKSMEANFTNEGGYDYRFRYLKNIMGLWMIQSIRHNYGDRYSFAELEQFAREHSNFPSRVDVNSRRFLAPDNMLEEVRAACRESGQPVPEHPGEVMQCVYQSLAESYRDAVLELQDITGKTYASINIVGGGSKDSYLNMLTAAAAGLPVHAGPTEGTALGNLLVQMISAGEFPGLQAARAAVSRSFDIKEYKGESQ